jgi:2-polyprenyl-3-methyl-5-hydroxy-6-metoxy-1,4-benzoquinol methylase
MQTHPTWRLDSQQLENVACPLCNGKRFRQLASSDRYDMDLRTAGCEGCGLVMTNPQPTGIALDQFYQHHYRSYYQKTEHASHDYIREYRKDERAAEAAAYMQQHGMLRDDMIVLDIGASEGCLLHAIAALVPSARRVAVEPNAQFAEFAMTHAGCTWHDSLTALRRAQPQARFDLVTVNHVYEHVKHPLQFLRDLAPLLAPQAQVYIDVPDVTAYRRLEDLHIAHLYHFSADTLRRAAEASGYRVEQLQHHAPVMHPVSLRCVLRVDTTARAAPLVNRQDGWSAVRRAGRRAWHFHRKRWPVQRRLAHLLGLR